MSDVLLDLLYFLQNKVLTLVNLYIFSNISYSYCILFIYLTAFTPICVYMFTCSHNVLGDFPLDSKLCKETHLARLLARRLNSIYCGAST